MKIMVKDDNVWYDAKTMEYKVTSYNDVTCNGIIEYTDAIHEGNKPKMKNLNAEYVSSNYSSLRGLTKAFIAAGCKEVSHTLWHPYPTKGGFRANMDLPPVIALHDMEDVKRLGVELLRTKMAKVTFLGLIELNYHDLSYNDNEFRYIKPEGYKSDRYTMYAFSYGSSDNRFCIRVRNEGVKAGYNQNIVDYLTNIVHNGLSNELSDFIKECRAHVKGI